MTTALSDRMSFCVAGLLQHVPRINGEIPSIDEATLDHQRLLDRCSFGSFDVECFLVCFIPFFQKVFRPSYVLFLDMFSKLQRVDWLVMDLLRLIVIGSNFRIASR